MDTTKEKNLLHFISPPIQPWQHVIFAKAGISVDVLRLDLMHPVIGGNKWIKLKGFFEQLIANGKAGIFTKGGPWSNHLHACAWLCNQLQLVCAIWVKGNNSISSAMLKDVADWNATIKFINRTEFYDEEKAIEFAKANNLLYVPMGGAAEAGVEHVSKFIKECSLPFYDYAICAVGTATTFGGFAASPDNFTKIIGIDAGTKDDLIKQKIKEWQQILPEKELILNADYNFGGFAKHTPELINFMNELYAGHQIPTDIVYTGKLFYAVLNLTANGYFSEGVKLLVVHSGGLQGNRSLPAGTLQF